MPLFNTEWNPSRRQLRHFVWTAALVLAFIAWRWPGPFGALVLRLVAALLFALGTVWPPLFRWLYRSLLVVTYPLSWTAGHLLLALIYFVFITPLALLFRLWGRDPLGRSFRPEAVSYWQPRSGGSDRRRYFHQF
jgi:hypothetical protein